MIDSSTDRSDHTFPDAGNDCRLAGTADIPIEIGANGDARFNVKLDSVLRDTLKNRCFDNFWCDKYLQRFYDVTAGEIDRRRPLPLKRNLCALRCDHRKRDVFNVTTGKVMRLQLIDR